MQLPPFEPVASRTIRSLNIEFQAYRHRATGARHFHLASDDPNNAFMVALPTLPADSTGAAHILEHTSLCGSARYPVRDPFFMMLRRSLNTFMNAFTGSDNTAYPFATQNRKDFDNLLAVYLDAVFFPCLDPLDFAQEGCRVELEDDTDPGAGLVYKGVVYNEMKGAMSAPLAQLWHHLRAQIFPATTYRFNSGGDPAAIPDLTHDDLRAFHARHYHPTHAIFMTYGNFPVAEHQRLFHERALSRFGRDTTPIVSHPQPPLPAPVTADAFYACDAAAAGERATHVVWGWMLGASADPAALLAAHLISGVLLEHSASPLRHCLETTAYANAPSELCGIDDSACQIVFSCGVEGADDRHLQALEADVFGVLRRVAAEGVEKDTLVAIIERMEMAQRDIGGDALPYGLQLMGRALPGAIHGGDPAALLDIDAILAGFQRQIADPDYVKALVRTLLVDNVHRARIVMRPDPEKAARDEQEEQDRLAALRARLARGDIDRLREQARSLRERQSRQDDPDILPRLTLADVPAGVPRIAARAGAVGGVPLHGYARGTNGLTHVQQVIDLPVFTDEELRHLPLFCDYLTEIGMRDETYLEVQARRARAGTFGASLTVRADLHDAAAMRGQLVVAAKGLDRKTDMIVDTLCEILPGARFDEHDRVRELLAQSRSETELSITDRGHHLATIGAARALSPGGSLDDLWEGPAGIGILKSCEERARAGARDVAEICALLAGIRDKLVVAPRRLLVVAEAEQLGVVEAALARTPPGPAAGTGCRGCVTVTPAAGGHAGWITNTRVNFCAKAYAAVAEGHEDAVALMVLGRYLQDGFLHPAIREAGGAYGSGAVYDADSATFRFFSYRDPRLEETLCDFDHAVDWLHGARDPRRLEEAVLGVIRALDQPRSPAGEAVRAFFDELQGRSADFREARRERVLATTNGDLETVAARYLVPGMGTIGVIAGGEKRAVLDQLGIAALVL